MLRLRGAFSENPRVAPLQDGTVTAPDIHIDWQQIEPNTAFMHHLQANDFDVFEFSISNYLITRARRPNRWDWTAIPVFMSKANPMFTARASQHAGIEGPEDLRGKRFGLLEYGMTAGLWLRAMVHTLHGIEPADLAWYVDGSRDALLGVRGNLPADISVTFLDREGAVGEMLQASEIDAAFLTGTRPPTDTSRPLLADGGRAFTETFFRQSGCTPVNHTVVVQRRILEQNPWVAEALLDTFERSKHEAYRRDRSARAIFRAAPPAPAAAVDAGDLDWQISTFGDDPYPSGLAANRAMLALAAEQSVRDGLTPTPVDVDTLFYETVRST
jgi:4,5-dihydroxyphthalate decarboxylase